MTNIRGKYLDKGEVYKTFGLDRLTTLIFYNFEMSLCGKLEETVSFTITADCFWIKLG